METAETIAARASRIEAGLQQAFGVRAGSLNKALKRTGRRLPRRLHAEAAHVIEAQGLGGNPKLMRQVDGAMLDRAEEVVLAYLDTIDRSDRRKGMWLGLVGVIAFNLLLVIVGFLLWMIWSGQA